MHLSVVPLPASASPKSLEDKVFIIIIISYYFPSYLLFVAGIFEVYSER